VCGLFDPKKNAIGKMEKFKSGEDEREKMEENKNL